MWQVSRLRPDVGKKGVVLRQIHGRDVARLVLTAEQWWNLEPVTTASRAA
jgi:hypothetical protein